MMYIDGRPFAEALYYYELYKKEAIAKGEKPLTMLQLIFKK